MIIRHLTRKFFTSKKCVFCLFQFFVFYTSCRYIIQFCKLFYSIFQIKFWSLEYNISLYEQNQGEIFFQSELEHEVFSNKCFFWKFVFIFTVKISSRSVGVQFRNHAVYCICCVNTHLLLLFFFHKTKLLEKISTQSLANRRQEFNCQNVIRHFII